MTIERDAIFLAGIVTGTYALRRDGIIPDYIQAVINRVMQASSAQNIDAGLVDEHANALSGSPSRAGAGQDEITPSPLAKPQEALIGTVSAELSLSDEDKIATHIAKGLVTEDHKPRKAMVLTDEERARRSEQAKKNVAARMTKKTDAARVTITVNGKPIEEAHIEDWREPEGNV